MTSTTKIPAPANAYASFMREGGYLWLPDNAANRKAFVSTRIAREVVETAEGRTISDNYTTLQDESLERMDVSPVCPFPVVEPFEGKLRSHNPNCGTGYTLIPVSGMASGAMLNMMAGWIACQLGVRACMDVVCLGNIHLVREFLEDGYFLRL